MGANKKGPAGGKVTQAEIARRQALMAAAKAKPAAKKSVDAPKKLEENTNKQVDVIEATGVDAALSALGGGYPAGKRMSYKEFEELNLAGVKEENPGLKNSQAKDHVWKMWERAPETPKNQTEAK